MKFLIDNQLPPELCRQLRTAGFEAKHVIGIGFAQGSDRAIWDYARLNGFILISKDEDFSHLANRSNDEGFLVWLRFGNSRRAATVEKVAAKLPEIIAAFEGGARIVEIF